jgi:thiol-disulfide isomerase/thioredoxin
MKRAGPRFWLGVVLATAAGAGATPPDSPSATAGIVAPPAPRNARDLGVGRYVADASGRDLAGKATSWRSGRGERLTVIALTSVTCPLCKKFAPSLARIEAAYANKGVKFVYVNVSGVDTAAEMQQQIKDQTRRMALALNVVGLMNVQFAIQNGVVYVLEVNPRASRTVPFVSKATGVQLAKGGLAVGRTLWAGVEAPKALPIEIDNTVAPLER